jgi:hypothetical protein
MAIMKNKLWRTWKTYLQTLFQYLYERSKKNTKIWPRTDPLGRSIQVKYCCMWTRYWVTTSKQTMKQHLLLANRFLISKYTQPLLGNAFTNKHVPTETIGVQKWTMFSARSEPKCYNRDKFRSSSFVTELWESCKGVCEEMTCRCSWRILTVQSFTRERLVKTQETENT